MFRYIALLWDTNSSAQTSTARALASQLREAPEGWTLVLENTGIWVFVAGLRPSTAWCPLADRAGVILGTLFEQHPTLSDAPSRRVERLDGPSSATVVESAGHALISTYWGRYVAFLCDGRSKKWVIRGPLSTLPCYLTRLEGMTLVYSRSEDCQKLTGMSFTADRTQLAIRVATGRTRIDTSLLNEVSTLYPGECLKWTPVRQTRSYYWHPSDVARSHVIESLDEATEGLRRTSERCVRAWGTCYDSVLMLLSGGFDSSALLGSLAVAPRRPQITCVTLWSPLDNGVDERPYARLAAARANVALIEHQQSQDTDARALLQFVPQPAPFNNVSWTLQVMPALRPLARQMGAQGLLHAVHGDSIFYNHHPELVGVDYAARHGLKRELLTLSMNVSAYTQYTVWELLSDALRYRTRAKRWDDTTRILRYRQLVRPEVLQLTQGNPDQFVPWLCDSAPLPPGKLSHVSQLVHPSDYYHPLEAAGDAEVTDPFCSQPLVDMCLRIPTYLHTYDGRPRALARRAHAHVLPEEITRRYWKSGASGYFKKLLITNQAFFRELLLDGKLVREFLDRRKVEAALSGEPLKSAVHTNELLDYACIEAWLTHFALAERERSQVRAAS